MEELALKQTMGTLQAALPKESNQPKFTSSKVRYNKCSIHDSATTEAYNDSGLKFYCLKAYVWY